MSDYFYYRNDNGALYCLAPDGRAWARDNNRRWHRADSLTTTLMNMAADGRLRVCGPIVDADDYLATYDDGNPCSDCYRDEECDCEAYRAYYDSLTPEQLAEDHSAQVAYTVEAERHGY